MPSWREQKLPSQQWQRCLCIDGNDPITGNDASLTMRDKWCMHAHTQEQTYKMFVFVRTLANTSYVWACVPACKPCKPLLWASAWQTSPSPCLPPCFTKFGCRNWGQFFMPRQESANNSYVGATIMSRWCSCVLYFLAGLTFWAKPLCPNLSNRERKVWAKSFVQIPEWRSAIMYTIRCIRVEVASPQEGERAALIILVWPQTLACFIWDVSVFCVVS